MKPKIRDGVSVLYRETEEGSIELNFLVESTSTIIPFHVDYSTLACVRLFDGQRTLEDISDTADVALGAINSLIDTLTEARVLSNGEKPARHHVGSRFETQAHFFSGFAGPGDQDAQELVSESHVAIIGVGGIGSWVAYGLVLAGVKNLTLVDPDTVELSNLNRQALYDLRSVGRHKVTALSERLNQVEPTAKLKEIRLRVESESDCVAIATGSKLVISCADDPGTDEVNRVVSKACYGLGIPHILCGGYDGHLGFVGPTIVPEESGCWMCYEKTLEHQLLSAGYKHLLVTTSHVKGGNLGAISSIVANYHVLEALKVISGFTKPTLINQVAELDFLTYRTHLRQYHKLQGCRICCNPIRR